MIEYLNTVIALDGIGLDINNIEYMIKSADAKVEIMR